MIDMGIVGQAAAKEKRRNRLKMSFSKFRNSQNSAKMGSYPSCSGTLKDCPASIENPHNPPACCRVCPQYMESKFYQERNPQERAKELHELFKNFGKSKTRSNLF